jgi:hypothetical protein
MKAVVLTWTRENLCALLFWMVIQAIPHRRFRKALPSLCSGIARPFILNLTVEVN